ncbi:hypothetical protein M8C21_018630, partial [Ambrosia artemisiifolia]
INPKHSGNGFYSKGDVIVSLLKPSPLSLQQPHHSTPHLEHNNMMKTLKVSQEPGRQRLRKANRDFGVCKCSYSYGYDWIWSALSGWVTGSAVLIAFSFIIYLTSTLLADAYRSPDLVSGKRNYTYMDVVCANLGGKKVQLCGIAQYANLVGVTIGYTITGSINMGCEKIQLLSFGGNAVSYKSSNN